MMVKLFRAALLGAALLMSAATVGFAQSSIDQYDATLNTNANGVVSAILSDAASMDSATFASAVAALVQAHPDLAEAIAAVATNAKPAAAAAIATQVAAVAPPAAAAAVVNAIVAQVAPADKATVGATIVSNYIASAPPAAVQTIATALTPVLNQITAAAAGGQNSQQQVSANQALINTAVKSNSSPG